MKNKLHSSAIVDNGKGVEDKHYIQNLQSNQSSYTPADS